MAKLTGPLFSLSASGSIAKTLTYFPWKGLKLARQWIVPANPNTQPQINQRGHVTDAVATIHAAQVEAADPMNALDIAAYNLLASTRSTPRTWFNEAVKNFVDQRVSALRGLIFRGVTSTPGLEDIAITLEIEKDPGTAMVLTNGTINFGVNKSTLINSMAATIVAESISATIVGLTSGQRYYWQFRATVDAEFLGAVSGIYSDIAG